MTHYYSNYKIYQECPQQYLYKKGHPDIDLGYGKGNAVPKNMRQPPSQHAAIAGQALAEAMDRFYNQRLWESPKMVRDRFKEIAIDTLNKGFADPGAVIHWHEGWTPTSKYDWRRCPPLEVVRQEVLEQCDNFFEIIKLNSLLSEDAVAESHLKWTSSKGVSIGSRPDLTFTNKKGQVEIVDGKTSKTIGRHVSVDQLYWYALVHWKVTSIMPEVVRFLYFKHPPTMKTKNGKFWLGTQDFEVRQEDLEDLLERIEQFDLDVKSKKFDPNLTFSCTFCQFEHICEARQNQIKEKDAPLETRQVGRFVEIL